MVLAEVIIEKINLELKIEQLQDYLNRVVGNNTALADTATTKLLDLFDKYRSHLMLINKINNSVNVSIGDQQISLANAILFIKTLKRKIELLNSLIDNEDCVLDVFDLMDQRDILLNEYTTIANNIASIEWNTKIDKESMG